MTIEDLSAQVNARLDQIEAKIEDGRKALLLKEAYETEIAQTQKLCIHFIREATDLRETQLLLENRHLRQLAALRNVERELHNLETKANAGWASSYAEKARADKLEAELKRLRGPA